MLSHTSGEAVDRRRLNVTDIAGGTVIAALLVWAYYPAVNNLIESWSANTQTYSYGFLIPFVSAALIWIRRDRLAQLPVRSNLKWGVPWTLIGLGMLFVGRLSMLSVLEELSLIVTLAGLTLLLFGTQILGAMAFPICYLLAMVPMWDILTARIHPYFQDLSATVGMAVLRALSIPALRRGLFIDLPNVTLEVAQECSGVNNLIAVLCVGIPMVYLFVSRWWKRAVILSVGVLISVLSNGLRVAMVSVFAYYGIRGANGDIHGPYSLLRSLLVSGVGFITLFWLVSRFGDEIPAPSAAAQPATSAPHSTERVGVLRPLSVSVAALMMMATLAASAWQRPDAVQLRAHLGTFPHQIGEWESIAGQDSPSGLELLNFDARLFRSYRDPHGAEASVFIGYYGQQRQGQEIADFRMRGLLFGVGASDVSLHHVGPSTVSDFLTTEGGQKIHVSYWYVLHGRTASRDFQAKFYTALNALAYRATDGAVIVVKTKVAPAESMESVRTRVTDFIHLVDSASVLYLPRS